MENSLLIFKIKVTIFLGFWLIRYLRIRTNMRRSKPQSQRCFKIKETIDDEYTHAFVYGQYIDDFYVLEKDTIFTLTTSAVKALDVENQELKNKVSNLELVVYDLTMRLASLEAKLS